ncbi:O-antigen ligase [Anaerosolibacter carboniphilus]|uniref:O-antigen ligase n=1 Tax=Anaerosolibacter carboniphilus TaxID=1417629 RepID=A0A841L1X6_9FIRM|nr:O-antigen ligase family protein [Anaerosolibacter carboniphilus]MBB6216365.1 O-antigen ligase [Anaerosolibacter carboniphilus]
MTIKTKKKTNDLYGILSPGQYLVFISLCILLFYPPFFRGLFFEKELLITHIFTFILFGIWILSKIKSVTFKLVDSKTDILALGVLLMYGISILYGVNTRLSIAEFLKYANYIAIYFMVKKFTQEYPQTKKYILHALLFSGVIVSIIGVGSAIGTFNYNGAFASGRINSTFQYPNTLASYLFVLFILALGLLQDSESKKEQLLYGGLCNIYLFTFIPTFSRGMWLLAPIIYLVYFACIPNKKKMETIYFSILTMLPAGVFSLFFIRGIGKSPALLQWMITILSIGITIGLIYLLEKRNIDYDKISFRKILMVATVLVIGLVIAITLAFSMTQPLTLSNMSSQEDAYKIVTRDISNIFKNMDYRFEVSAIIKNPENKPYGGRIDIYSINGKGESEVLVTENIVEDKKIDLSFTTLDTTEAIRISFSNYYGNTEVVFDQGKVFDADTGEKINDLKLSYKYIPESLITRINSITAGDSSIQGRMSFYKDALKIIKDRLLFGAGGGAWATLYFMYQSYMYWTTQAHNYFLQLWIEIGTVGLLIYLTFIIMMLFNVFKTLRKSDSDEIKITEVSISIGWVAILAHSVMDFDLSLGAMSILLWTLYALTRQDFVLKVRETTSLKYYRYGIVVLTFALALGSMSLSMAQGFIEDGILATEQKEIQEAIGYFEKAAALDPFSASNRIDLATLYIMTGKNDQEWLLKTEKQLEKAVELEPYSLKILKKAAELSIQTGHYLKGLGYLDQMIEVQPMHIDNYVYQTNGYLTVISFLMNSGDRKSLENVIDKIPDIKNMLNKTAQSSLQPIQMSVGLDLNLQKLDYVLENRGNIEKLKRLKDVEIYNNFDMDIDQNNIPDGARITNTPNGKLKLKENEQYVTLLNEGSDYGVFWIDHMKLESNSNYILEVNYSSTVQDDKFDLYVYDYSSGKSTIIARLDNLQKSDHFTTRTLQFITPEAITAEKQRIGVVHRGNDEGVIKIRQVSLMKENN